MIEGAVNNNDRLDSAEQQNDHQVDAPEHPEYLDESLNHARTCESVALACFWASLRGSRAKFNCMFSVAGYIF